jgi:phosphatidylinositol phospholipase C delta
MWTSVIPQEFDIDHNKTISYDEFKEFYNSLFQRPEIREIFSCYAGNKNYLTQEEFSLFLSQKQKEYKTPHEVQLLMEKFERIASTSLQPSSSDSKVPCLSFRGFALYISGDDNSVFCPQHRHVYQDTSLPITHYWIASSHNTYLERDQLFGMSSTKAYIAALNKGCRCVELDCWDGPNDEPIVYHGHTLTSHIPFRDVIQTIKMNAFKLSPFPVILDFEMHCNLKGQTKIAQILKEELGDMLSPPFSETGTMPPLNGLLNKVLIKGWKPPKKHSAAEYQELINLECYEFDFHHYDRVIAKPWKAIQFAEDSAMDALKHQQNYDILLELNKRQLTRIYPKGTRFDSSNYLPTPYWNVGCQLVSLNYQSGDRPMWINEGLFGDNGSCGYVLKPEYLREAESSTLIKPYLVRPIQKTLHIRILSGWRFPKPASHRYLHFSNKSPLASSENEVRVVVDPFVRVTLYGSEHDHKTVRTHTVFGDGFNPQYQEDFEFPIQYPELALLLFEIIDDIKHAPDSFLAQYCIRVLNVREGYRTLKLKDSQGFELPNSRLLCHFLWK